MLIAPTAPIYSLDMSDTLFSARSRFLIVGFGNEHCGDEAVGPQVARTVAQWRLPDVETLMTSQLRPGHAAEITAAEYVIFVAACRGYRCARTVQFEPIVGESQPLRRLSGQPQSLNPWTLLNLVQQRYDSAPQAWLLQIPAERFEADCLSSLDLDKMLSATAQNGCDRALATITKFFQTYQDPAQLFRAAPSAHAEIHSADGYSADRYRDDLTRPELHCA